jgi:hypothetical protein
VARVTREVLVVSDVFGRRAGDDRLEAEISAALAARVHRRARMGLWCGGIALAGALALAVMAIVVLADAACAPLGSLFSLVALAAAVSAGAITQAARARTRRLLASSAPEGGIVIGLSSAGVHLAHLPLLEWSVVTGVCVADRVTRQGRDVTVGLAVTDVGRTRARVIDARLTHVVRPFPRARARRGDGDQPGFLTVALADLLDDATIDEAITRLELEAHRHGIPFWRAADERALADVLRQR